MNLDRVALFNGIAALLMLNGGCSMVSMRPTIEMVDARLKHEKKNVDFISTVVPSVIEERTLKSGCGAESQTISGTAFVPGAVVPVVSTYDFSVDHGKYADGSIWLGLRMDGPLHGLPSGARLVPRGDGGTDVTVLTADKRKVDIIKQRVEEGTLFCHWRDFDYPYD